MNLDKATFGNTPAALYLTLLLNERGDKKIARKIAKILAETRELLHEIETAHLSQSVLSARSLSKLLVMVFEQTKVRTQVIEDQFLGHIVMNILTGEIRTIKRRCQLAAKIQAKYNRYALSGYRPDIAQAVPLDEEMEVVQELQKRSAEYLARKNKPNTLY